ncbi:MAG: DUF4340 domain-containing protein [Planctomycetes bacterium]|nr:DUF4340 domain-containing protein [Planctomycetota bacterium]
MKTNVFLAAVAAVLAVPTVITIVNEQGSFTRYEDVPRLFDGFTPEKVAGIRISKVKLDDNGAPITGRNGQKEHEVLAIGLTSSGDWVIADQSPLRGAPVKKDTIVTHILQHIEQIRRDEDALIEVDASDEALAEYGLDEDHGVLIQCFDANNRPVVELIKGRSARDAKAGQDSLRGHFVRRKDRQDIVLYEQDYWNLQLEPRGWFDRSLIPGTAATQAVRFRMKNAHGEIELAKDKPTDVAWRVVKAPEGCGAPRQAEINALAGRIAQASVADYIQPLPSDSQQRALVLKQVGFSDDAAEAEFELEDGTIYTLYVGNKLEDKHEYRAVASNRDFLLTVPGHVRTTMDKDLVDLFDVAKELVEDTPPKDADTPPGDAPSKDGDDDGGK